MKLTVCELFAGVGGFRLGLEKSGWKTVWANQYEPSTKKQHAADCYKKNFGEKGFVVEDINSIDISKIPNHELLVAGFPCQDYSVATSQAKGIQGKKGVLWWNIRDVILKKNPNFILLENVDRLLTSPSAAKGRDFGVILSCLRDLGYSVEWRVLNAADYGFPQKRKRIFIFASNNNTKYSSELVQASSDPKGWITGRSFFAKDFPPKTIKELEQVDLFDWSNDDKDLLGKSFCWKTQEISDGKTFKFMNSGFLNKQKKIYTFHLSPNYNGDSFTLRDILIDEIVDDNFYITENIGKKNIFKNRIKKSEIPPDIRKTWFYVKGSKNEWRQKEDYPLYKYNEGPLSFPDKLDSPARTMLTSEGSKSPNRSTHVIQDPLNEKYRLLTPIECERLNGFKDNWTLKDNKGETIPNSKRYFFMGNALVVGLVEKMGYRIKLIVKKEKSEKKSLNNIIRWAGSKRLLLTKMKESFPKNIEGNYIEPFVGSGSILSFILRNYEKNKDRRTIINDANSELINFYRTIKYKFDDFNNEIIRKIIQYSELTKNGKSKFYKKTVGVTNEFSISPIEPDINKAVRFYILNRLSFNGIYRVSSNGKYNVPMDSTKENIYYNFNIAENLHKNLKDNNVEIYNHDFKEILKLAQKKDFIYIDPPYYSERNDSYVGYTGNVFCKNNHEDLHQTCLKLSLNGINFLLSSSDNKMTKNFFKDEKSFITKEVEVRRTINSKINERLMVKELLITNY